MKTQNSIVLLTTLLMLFIASCEYEFIEPEPPPIPTDTISFSGDIVPIWEDNNCTNCHKPNGVSQLDLTAANAYNSLTSFGLVNTVDPASSKIYTYPHPISGEHANKYSSEAEAEFILQWISQGARNN